MEFTSLYTTLISLLTLTFLEIVLGVDNLVFISIASSRLPPHQQKSARRVGLLIALVTRLMLLASALWIMGLHKPIFSIFSWGVSGRDILLGAGGLFLIYKGTVEIHAEMENHSAEVNYVRKFASWTATVIQIGIFDIIFSLDSVLTAVGLVQNFLIMAIAIIIAVIVMMVGSEPLSHFVNRHPTIKMLALSFLLLIGVVLIADCLHFDIPRGYIYFAVCFSVFVEFLNSLLRKKQKK